MKAGHVLIPITMAAMLSTMQGCGNKKPETAQPNKESISTILSSTLLEKETYPLSEQFAVKQDGETLYEKVISEGHVIGYKTQEEAPLFGSNSPSYDVGFLLDDAGLPYYVKVITTQNTDTVEFVDAYMQDSELSFGAKAITVDKYLTLLKRFRDLYDFKSVEQKKALNDYISEIEQKLVISTAANSKNDAEHSEISLGDKINGFLYNFVPH